MIREKNDATKIQNINIGEEEILKPNERTR